MLGKLRLTEKGAKPVHPDLEKPPEPLSKNQERTHS